MEKDFDSWNSSKKKIQQREHKVYSAAVLSQLRLLSNRRMVQYVRTISKEEFMELVARIKQLFPER